MEQLIAVLSAGDDESVRLLRTRTLREAGIRVTEAARAADALALAQEDPPDLFLVAPCLEDMPGAAFVQRLQGDPALAAIPLICIGFGPAGPATQFPESVAPELLVTTVQALVRLRRLEQTGEELRRAQDALRSGAGPAPAGHLFPPLPEIPAGESAAPTLAEAAGDKLLDDVIADYLALLGTSSALFAPNGDCLARQACPEWCRLLDARTAENGLCQEARRDVAMRAMESRQEVERECPGGLRLYGLPILAGGETAGSLTIGYGDPPRDPEKLAAVSVKYGLPVEELRARAAAFEPFPAVLAGTTQRRARTAAKLLGSLLEQRGSAPKAAELRSDLNRRIHDFESLFELSPIGICVADDPECRTIRANPAMLEILGVTGGNASELVPGTCYRVMRDGVEIPAEELPLQVAAREGRAVAAAGFEIVRADGSVRIIFGHSSPMFERGTVRGAIAVFIDVTAQKHVQEALHAATQRLNLHVENSPLAVIEWDREHRITRWTGAAPKVFGWTAEEALGRLIDDMPPIHQGDLPRVLPIKSALLSGGCMSAINECRNHRKDGAIIHCEWHTSALYDSSGELVSMLSLALDVTERKRAEEARRKSESKLRAVLDALPVGVWFLDKQGKVLHSNPATIRIWGGSSFQSRSHYVEYRGRWLESGLPVAREEWASSQALAGVAVLGQIIEIDCLDGSRKVINNSAVPLVDENGQVTGAAVLNEDITEHIRTSEELKKREARLEHAQRMASLGHWELEPTGVLKSSEEVYRIFGLRRNEFPADREGFSARIHPEDRDRCRAAIEQARLEGKPYDLDYRILRPDGSERVVREHAEPMFDEASRLARIMGTIQDVTEYRRLEDQLREAQKLESVGRLAGGVAHDFNNLLTVIVGYSDFVLGMLEAGHPARAGIEEIHKAGDRASALTRQLLAFSRRQVVQPRVLDINTVIAEAGKMLNRLVGEDVEISTVLAPKLWPVLADPGLIEQVLMNLVVNARDAMPEGGRLVLETHNILLDEHEARQHHGMRPGPHVLLAVSDTGVGMDAATRARIFEPFFTTKPLGTGTGLGLSTCYGIVTQAGGWIGVYSEPGRGSTFRIYLPRVEDDTPVETAQSRAATVAGGDETILVVEDQDEVRRFACDALRGYGYTVHAAASGTDALRLLAEISGPIDLLITDLVMPDLSGRDLADRVAELRPGMPTLFMSGYSDEVTTRQRVVEPGAAYLQKPFTPSALARKVRDVLSAAGRR
ncbi:MAG TPA: PAS domain S-box protein [Bryobacteraceae bacterium]|nr:PAS domain S-box protein [Bryobacteraceae bacterium]